VIVAFVDGDKESYDPDDMLGMETVQIILASSPRGVNRGWVSKQVTLQCLQLSYSRGVSSSQLGFASFNAQLIYFFRISLYPFDIEKEEGGGHVGSQRRRRQGRQYVATTTLISMG